MLFNFFFFNCYKLQDFVFSFGLVRFRDKNNLVMLWVQITTSLRLGHGNIDCGLETGNKQQSAVLVHCFVHPYIHPNFLSTLWLYNNVPLHPPMLLT